MRRLRVAVIGKGGAGKSTISGTMARLLARRGARVLALDSDPMPGLSISLGLGRIDDAMLMEAVEKGEEGRWRLKSGIGPARAVSRFAVDAPDGVRFLQFGKATPDGLREILPSVTAFGEVVHGLARDRVMTDWSVVGDLSAGTRQAAYDWAPYARVYLIIAQPTWQSALTARRLMGLAAKRDPEEILLVANKVERRDDADWLAERIGVTPAVALPSDPSVVGADRKGMAPIDYAPESPVVLTVDELLDTLVRGARPASGHPR